MQGALAPGLVIVEGKLLPPGAVEDHIHYLRGQVLHRGVQLEAVLFGQGVKVHPGDAVGLDVAPAGGGDGPLQNGQLLVGNDEIRVYLQLAAQAGTGGTGPVWVVEGEHPGGELLNGHAAVLAGVVLGEQDVPVLPHHIDHHQAAGQVGGDLHAVRQAAGDVLPDDQAVHHDLDVVLLVLLQLDLFTQVIGDAVHPAAHIAGAAGVLEDLGVLALLAPDHRGHDLDPGGLRQFQHLVDDLVDGLLFDLLAAYRAVGGAHPGPEQAEIVIDLGDSAHGGPGILAGGLLVDGDGGGEAVDVVHVGLLHLPQEHPGIGGQGLHIPPLSLRVDGVEGQGGFAAPRQAGEHHQLVPRNGHIHIFQVVFPGSFYINMILHSSIPRLYSSL